MLVRKILFDSGRPSHLSEIKWQR